MENVEKRGRPKLNFDDELPKPRKWVRKMTNEDGSIDIWKYDLDYPGVGLTGLVETETIYPNKLEVKEVSKINNDIAEPLDQSDLPKSQRKYLNPANGKWVGYTRAHNLGLI